MFEIAIGIVVYLILGGVTAGLWRRFMRGPLHPLGAVLWPLVIVASAGALLLDVGMMATRKLLGHK